MSNPITSQPSASRPSVQPPRPQKRSMARGLSIDFLPLDAVQLGRPAVSGIKTEPSIGLTIGSFFPRPPVLVHLRQAIGKYMDAGQPIKEVLTSNALKVLQAQEHVDPGAQLQRSL